MRVSIPRIATANALLIVWVAFISADRIDLAGKAAPFVLTPFLALTPVVAGSEMLRRFRLGRPVEVSTQALAFILTCATLVCVVLLSSFNAQDISKSTLRALLLVADIGGTFPMEIGRASRRGRG